MQVLGQLLDGQKTYLAGIGLMLWALAGFALTVAGVDSPAALDANAALQHFLEGLAVLGVGHKVEKLTNATKDE